MAKIQAIPASMRMAVKEEAIRLIDADRARLSVSAGMLCREIIAKINWSKGKDWHSRSQHEKACGLGRSTVKRAYDELAMYGHALRREADRPDGGHGNAETTLPVLLVAYQRLATNGITLGPE